MSSLLLFLTCVIFFIQTTVSSEPAPAPHNSSEPAPTPRPIPEPVPTPHPEPVPTPGSEPSPHPVPTPGSEPVPHPEPTPGSEPVPTPQPMPVVPPEPMPVPVPVPVPVPAPTVDDFYFNFLVMSKFGASFEGVISMSGANNDTISIYGNQGVSGTFDFVQQFSLATYEWTNLTTWNTSCKILSYSQPPPDGTQPNGYPTYFLWSAGTPVEYWVSSFATNVFTQMFNVSFPIEETGQRIVALSNGAIYIYGSKTGLRSWDMTTNGLLTVNTTQPGGWRDFAALVGYNNGFFVHGGLLNATATTDFWYYDAGMNHWSAMNSTGIPASFNHIASLSSYPTQSGTNENYIFFTGIPENGIILYDINGNASSVPNTKMSIDPLDMPLTTIAGSRLFIFGGRNRNNSMLMSDLWQFVNERYCTSVMNCDDCVGYPGCIFCNPSVTPNAACVAGNSTHAFISQTCPSTVVSTVETCPEAFPSWAIALIVIGGVILVGGIVFGIMKLRAVKPGYDPV